MTTYKIYQVNFDSDFFRNHRFYGWDNTDICTKKDVKNAIYDGDYNFVGEMSADNLNELFHIGICTKKDVKNAIYDGDYNFVGEMSADNLNELFHIGNTGGQPNGVASLSVGDVIVDENGGTIVIAPEGFDLIGFDLTA
jgi:hypothetical protein